MYQCQRTWQYEKTHEDRWLKSGRFRGGSSNSRYEGKHMALRQLQWRRHSSMQMQRCAHRNRVKLFQCRDQQNLQGKWRGGLICSRKAGSNWALLSAIMLPVLQGLISTEFDTDTPDCAWGEHGRTSTTRVGAQATFALVFRKLLFKSVSLNLLLLPWDFPNYRCTQL